MPWKWAQNGSSANSKVEAALYFGSLRNAQRTLKNDLKLRHGLSKEKIIAVLSRMHRSKDRLAYASARLEVPALVSAAEAYFSSWIDPNLYFVRRKWAQSKSERKVKRLLCARFFSWF